MAWFRFGSESPEIRELRRLHVFEGLTRRELARIAAISERYPMRAGEIVMLEGYRGEQFLVLVEGEVEVSRTAEPLATLGPGDFVGEIGVLRGGDRSATVTARTDVKFIAFEAREFRGLLDGIPELRARVETVMSARTTGERQDQVGRIHADRLRS